MVIRASYLDLPVVSFVKLSVGLGLGAGETKLSVQRLFLLYELDIGQFGRQYSKRNELSVFSKNYLLESSHIPAEALELEPLTAHNYEMLKQFHPKRLGQLTGFSIADYEPALQEYS